MKMYPYPPYYIPAPPREERTRYKPATVKQLLKARKELDDLIEAENKKKKEKEKPKPKTFTVLEMMGLLTFFGPIVGIFWLVVMYNLQGILAETLKVIAK